MKSSYESPLNALVHQRLAAGLADGMAGDLEREFVAKTASFPYRLSARPLLIHSEEWDLLAAGLEDLSHAIETVALLYRAHREVRELFDIYEKYEPWILDHLPTGPAVHIARFDGVWHGGGDFTMMETNAGGPGGVVHIPLATRQWAATGWAQSLTTGCELDPYPMLRDPYWFPRQMLLSAARQGHHVTAVAIAKLASAVSYDIDYLREAFAALGCDSAIHDVRDFVGVDGVPTVGGHAYNLVYSKFVPFDVLENPGAAGFVGLFGQGGAFFVNSPLAQTILEDKAVLALLSDPQFAPAFSARHRAAIERHVPWTRLVRSQKTADPTGGSTSLVDYVLANREHLVLKPAHLYSGIDVTVGRYVSESQWRAALAAALRGRYVVQEYVRLPRVGIPGFGGPRIDDAFSDVSCFMVEGRLAGLSSRASTKPVVNIGAGGVARIPVLRVSRSPGANPAPGSQWSRQRLNPKSPI